MKSAALAILLASFVAFPLAAQRRATHITVFASQVDMDGDSDFDSAFETDFDEGEALGLAASFGLTPHFSLEAAAFAMRADAGLLFEGTAPFDLGTLNLAPITVGAQFHILGNRRIDPYIGAGGAYVLTENLYSPDLEAVGLGRIELENGLTYYYNAGIAFQLTEGFGLVLDARYIPFETESRSSVTGVEQDLDLSPRILSAGLRLRF